MWDYFRKWRKDVKIAVKTNKIKELFNIDIKFINLALGIF